MNRAKCIEAIDALLDASVTAPRLVECLTRLGQAYDRWKIRHLEEATDEQLAEAETIVRDALGVEVGHP